MASIEQGDLLKVEGIQHPVIVVSNDYFNQSGRAIVCPILKKTAPGPLHIRLRETEVDGSVLCEQVRTIDKARLREHMGRLDDQQMSMVDNAIAVSFGLHGNGAM